MTTVNQSDRAGRQPAWLPVLCAMLLVGQPLSLALTASRDLEALAIRGLPMALMLGVQSLVAAFGIAAGLALAGRRAGAVTLAKWSLVLSAATDGVAYATPFLPNNRMPGTTPYYVVASLAYYAIWLAYLSRSKRIRDAFPH